MRNSLRPLFPIVLSIVSVAQAAPVLVDRTQRPLRYTPQDRDFVVTNGPEFFNRPLYGSNTAFRADAGDKPEVSLYLPGRGGNLRLGIRRGGQARWLHEAATIVARYRPGSMLYEITDPLLGQSRLRLVIIGLHDADGIAIRAALEGDVDEVELLGAFGGTTGQRHSRDGDIGTDRLPMSEYFQLKPEFCADNQIQIDGSRFILTSKAAPIVGRLPEGATLAVGDATKWSVADELLASATRDAKLPVIVMQMKLSATPLHLAIQKRPADPSTREIDDVAGAFEAAEAHFRGIREKLVVDTPDPFVNAAVAALNVAADGVWDEAQGAYMHGAVAWRRRLLGWRGPYSGDALGWHDRIRRHLTYWAGQQNTSPIPATLPTPEESANLSRNENALHSNGDMSGTHYDMNLVYVDALMRHLLWTGDLEFARKMWPVIERHLAWERRLFRRPTGPEGLPLYEAYAAIWASDDLAYHGGGTTHASAYNHYHNKMAARIAKLIGGDPGPYEQEAELIARAMRSELWLPRLGWFAEWKDRLGLQLAHPNPAVWTLYHTIDSEVPSRQEAWQMTRFVDTQIAHIPIRGPGVPEEGLFTVPTSNWMPYTWSTNNVVMGEAAHTALAYWQAGRGDVAFKLFKGCILDSMFMGLCPGNVGMCTPLDMARGETQRDFADGVGAVSRAVVEGLFGIKPDLLAGEVVIRPGFPADWDRAAMQHTDFTFDFRREDLRSIYVVEPRFARPVRVRLQLSSPRDNVGSVMVNGKLVKHQLIEDSVGAPGIEVSSEPADRHEIVVTWSGRAIVPPSLAPVVSPGTSINAVTGPAVVQEVIDPQDAVSEITHQGKFLRAAVNDQLGHKALFAKLSQNQLTWWSPILFEVRPPHEIMAPADQGKEEVRFVLRNNTSETIDRDVPVRVGRRVTTARLRAAPYSDSDPIILSSHGFMPGTNHVVVGDTSGSVTNWKIDAAGRDVKWETVDLSSLFNDRVTRIFKNEYLSPRSGLCSLAIPKQGIGSWCKPTFTYEVDDSGLRSASDKNGGQILLPQGVPLKTPGSSDASNIAFVSQWDNYPREIEVPLSGNASHVYLLMAGSTNSMQSRFDNGEVLVTYADGSTQRLALENPTTWWPIDQDYLIDDFAFLRPEPLPIRVDLKTGTIRVLEMASFRGKGGRLNGGAATVVDLPLRPELELKSLKMRAIANEVVIGLMSVTLARE